MGRMTTGYLSGALLVGAAALGRDAAAQIPDTLVTPGAEYAAGGFHRWLFGSHYRDLWTTPVRVPVLDLHQFAGGLRPTERRRRQADQVAASRAPTAAGISSAPSTRTRTAAARAAPAHAGPADLPGSDQRRPPGRRAGGGPHPRRRGRAALGAAPGVLPDDPALGEFRADFGGLLGTIEERPTDAGPGFAGADKIVSTGELFERLEKDQDERVDTRAFLTARLVDLFLGDWDRHQDQWRWARLGDSDRVPWTPIPRDRDQAFARFDGLLLGLARLSAPQLVAFSPTYPSMVGLTWNARVLDRRLLSGLEWAVWDSVATDLKSRLTDRVIDDAVARLPREFQARGAAPLAAALKHRRDHLTEAALRFYRLLAAEADVYGSDKAERVEAARAGDRTLDLTIYPAKDGSAQPLFHRKFSRSETKEVRLYLHGGDDAVRVTGQGGGAPLLRIVGGGGDDRVVDSSSGGRVRVYDARGENSVSGSHRPPLDTRPFPDFRLTDSTPYPRRDWGGFWRFRPWFSSGPEVGLFVGGGLVRYDFGFRKRPTARGSAPGWATPPAPTGSGPSSRATSTG
jgi:hypothetical protein